MSLADLNGLEIQDGLLTLPVSGVWTFAGSVVLPDDVELPAGQVSITVVGDGEPTVVYRGTVASAVDPRTGSGRVRVVGGVSGGFSAEPAVRVTVGARSYDGDPVPITAAELLADLAGEAGETVAADTLPALQGLSAPAWHRVSGFGHGALATLLKGPPASPWGLSARFMPLGELWAGVETWDAVTDPDIVDPADDGVALHIAPRGLSWLPGQTVLGKRIRRVQYVLTADRLRARLWYGDA